MSIPEIAKKLLASSEIVHASGNIELQNWTNDLSDDQLESLWEYAEKKRLWRYTEGEKGHSTAFFIAKAELEKLAPR